jgi:uracil-DNA glycosylase family 4
MPDRDRTEPTASETALQVLEARVIECHRCPRLVEWREQVAREKRAAFRDDEYWGRPVPGFGDPEARLVVLGLAPAAHGANRTGRMFTGDRSGDWLYRALHRAGFANQSSSTGRRDGLELTDAWITAPVRCAPPANKPTAEERHNCSSYLADELSLLDRAAVYVCLGSIAYQSLWSVLRDLGEPLVVPRPSFGHGAVVELAAGRAIVASYHPSQQNTFTGRLSEEMFDDVFAAARSHLDARA